MNEEPIKGRVIIHQTLWTCAAAGCSHEDEQRRMESVHKALDAGRYQPFPTLPEGWRVIDGGAYCPNHIVAVTAVVRTPIVAVLTGLGRRIFVGGDLEEVLELQAA